MEIRFFVACKESTPIGATKQILKRIENWAGSQKQQVEDLMFHVLMRFNVLFEALCLKCKKFVVPGALRSVDLKSLIFFFF